MVSEYRGTINPKRCKASVHTEGTLAQWHQCSRKVWTDGWCKQHHPESVKARREERQRRYEEKLDARLAPIWENKHLKEINAELLAACEASAAVDKHRETCGNCSVGAYCWEEHDLWSKAFALRETAIAKARD